jgi:hypothetical protein
MSKKTRLTCWLAHRSHTCSRSSLVVDIAEEAIDARDFSSVSRTGVSLIVDGTAPRLKAQSKAGQVRIQSGWGEHLISLKHDRSLRACQFSFLYPHSSFPSKSQDLTSAAHKSASVLFYVLSESLCSNCFSWDLEQIYVAAMSCRSQTKSKLFTVQTCLTCKSTIMYCAEIFAKLGQRY